MNNAMVSARIYTKGGSYATHYKRTYVRKYRYKVTVDDKTFIEETIGKILNYKEYIRQFHGHNVHIDFLGSYAWGE